MISIPPIYVDIPLREYNAAMPDLFARAWANPSLALVRERGDLARETINVLKGDLADDARMQALEALRPRRHALLVRLIGHGESVEKRWMPNADEFEGIYDASPDFVRWLTERVMSALDDRLEREKKA